MTEPTPENPPVEEEPPGEEDPGGEQPAIPSDTPCTAVHPSVPGVACEIQFDNHALFRIVHTSHANGTVYEWE